jgi:hypothetical protein
MRISEALEQIKNSQYLLGTIIPGTNEVIDDIIPAPNNNQLGDFLDTYLKTESLSTAIQTFDIKDFEILLLSGTKKKGMFDTKTHISNAWYKNHY